MATFRFVHAADLHLDTPFHGLSRTAPAVAQALRDASLEAFDALIAWTLESEAQLLLLAGDIYDGAERGVRAQLRFRDGVERLSGAGIHTCVVHGNHDPLSGWSAIREWPARCTVFGAEAVGAVAVKDAGGQLLATVYGQSYAQSATHDNLALGFKRGAPGGLHIGLLHCNVGGHADHAPYSPCTLDDLDAAGMDYWALGHVHTRKVWERGRSHVVYPGNLQGRSPHAGERGEKGAYLVQVEDDEIRELTFRALDRVRFEHLDVDLTESEDLYAVKSRCLEAADTARRQHGERGVLLTATLRGRTAVHQDLARPGTVTDLLAELRDAFDGESPFLWWDLVRDRTRSPVHMQALSDRDDFLGALVRRSNALCASPDSLQAFIEEHTRQLTSRRLPREALEALVNTWLAKGPGEWPASHTPAPAADPQPSLFADALGPARPLVEAQDDLAARQDAALLSEATERALDALADDGGTAP